VRETSSRRVLRVRVRVSGKGRSSDKETGCKFPPSAGASDFRHVSPRYQHVALGLGYSKNVEPDGAHVGLGRLGLQGPRGGKGVVTRRLNVFPPTTQG